MRVFIRTRGGRVQVALNQASPSCESTPNSQTQKEAQMAVGVLMNFPGGTNDAYERVLERMGLTNGGRPPEHASFHIAGETGDGGFRVVDVWDSPEAFQKFAEEQITP